MAGMLYSESAEDIFKIGNQAFKDHFFSVAAGSFEKLLMIFPQDTLADDAAYFLGLSYFYSKQYNQTITRLVSFEQNFPSSPYCSKINYWIGASYYYQEIYDKSINYLDQQLKFPQEEYYYQQSLILKGIGLKKIQNYTEASLCFNSLLESNLQISQADYIYYQAGNNELLAGHYEKAAELFNRIVLNYPESQYFDESLFYLGECDYLQAKYDKALRHYESLIRLNKKNSHMEAVFLRFAQIYYIKMDFEKALDYIHTLITEYPQGEYYAESLKLKSDIYVQKNDYDEALYQYHLILDFLKTPEDIRLAQYNNGLLFYLAKDYDSAEESLKKALKTNDIENQDELNHKIRLKLADIYVIKKEFQKAYQYLNLYVTEKQSPYHKQALIIFGKLKSSEALFEESVKIWDQILSQYAFEKEYPEFLFFRADTHLKAENYSAALMDFQNIVKNHSHSDLLGESYYKIGYIYSQRKEYNRALEFYQQAAQWGRGTELEKRSLLAIGINYFNYDDIENAKDYFKKLTSEKNAEIANDKKNQEPSENLQWKGLGYFYLGKSMMKEGLLPLAAENFNFAFELLKTQAQGAEVLYWLGWAQYRQKHMKAAKDTFLKLTRLYDDSNLISEAYFRAGLASEDPEEQNYGEALLYYNKALALDKEYGKSPIRENILYQKGILLTHLGDSGKAQDVFEQLALEFPQSELAAEAWFDLGEDDMKKRNFLRAITRFEEFLKLFKSSQLIQRAYYQLAVANNEMGYSQKSLDYYYQYLKTTDQDRNQDQIIETIKDILQKQGNADHVLDFVNKINDDKEIPVLIQQKIAYEYASWLLDKEPEEAYKQLLALQKEVLDSQLSDQIVFRIGEYYLIKENYQYAQNIFKGLSDNSVGSTGAEAQSLVAKIYKIQGSMILAADEYIKTSYLFPQYKEVAVKALYQAYLILNDLGRNDDAEKIVQKIKLEYNTTSYYAIIKNNF
ncbi:MAG: tetratricopeptide repeat protein [Spirochaetales bacterium]|nr:tetratricopeptide repeat protein [Spirochaetales bacterium]